MQKITYHCSQCKNNLKKDDKLCTQCGSSGRNIHLQVTDRLEIHEQLRSKLKRIINGKTKVIQEQKIGDDYYRLKKSWSFLHRVIDRFNNHYSELIVDKLTGKVIKNKKGKLTEHTGHGSAKYRRKGKKKPKVSS